MTAREFLSSRKAPFELKDIRQDFGALRELVEDCQSRATPTLVVDGRVIMGFDPEEYEKVLAASGA